jgi:hypothetical protein
MREIIDRLLELEAKATSPKWKAFIDNEDGLLSLNEIDYSVRPNILISNASDVDDTENGSVIICANDLELIAEMRNNIRPLLLRMKALEDVASLAKSHIEYCSEKFLDSQIVCALKILDECGK